MNNNKIKKLTGTSIFMALVIVLQLISNYITLGPVSITLALVPIALGAIIYGPLAGLFLGLIHGAIVITAPSTLAAFMPLYPVQTVIVCLLKSGIAGLVSGLIFKYLKNKNFTLSIILASLCVPIINTGLFAIAMLTLLRPLLDSWTSEGNAVGYLFLSVIGYNFLIEFVINSALTPTIISLTKLKEKIK